MTDDPGLDIRERLLRRIYGEYMEMPGLRLTSAQAQRLWGIDEEVCTSVLNLLVEIRFLQRTGDGTFARLTDGAAPLPSFRMAKAQLDPNPAAAKKKNTPSAA